MLALAENSRRIRCGWRPAFIDRPDTCLRLPPDRSKVRAFRKALVEGRKPGAGFAISERDLDLRGAGDLFSERQSGHVQVFGPVLYSHLLKLASEKTTDGAADLWVPDLNLPVADILPTNYVQSGAVRLELYGRVARCRSEDDLEDLEEETARRFGRLPPAAHDFFAAARLRLDCKRRGIVRLDVGLEAVAATFLPGRLAKSKRSH